MQVTLAVVGRMKRGPAAELVEEYVKRTRWDVRIRELPDAPATMAPDARRAKEAAAILALVDAQARLVALDARGTPMSSERFAATLQGYREQGAKHLVLAIGGQDGLDAAVLARANATLAFGAATWPHQLVRVLLAEQLYRAYTIAAGHPYHLGH